MENDSQIILTTSRLILRLPQEADSIQFQAFDDRNSGQMSPWRSVTEVDHKMQIRKWEQEYTEGKSIRFILLIKENPKSEIVGFCNFTQIIRGPFQACYLGYHIDTNFAGKGLMSEAVEIATQYMFKTQKLHRIMANYMPSNQRSSRLLAKLGFVIEGRAKKYLLINNQWEDHILTSLTNESWLP